MPGISVPRDPSTALYPKPPLLLLPGSSLQNIPESPDLQLHPAPEIQVTRLDAQNRCTCTLQLSSLHLHHLHDHWAAANKATRICQASELVSHSLSQSTKAPAHPERSSRSLPCSTGCTPWALAPLSALARSLAGHRSGAIGLKGCMTHHLSAASDNSVTSSKCWR